MKYKFSGFILDPNLRQLSYKNKPVYLTKKCYDLLDYFLKNPNEAVTREQLVEHVWSGRIVTDNTIDQCISKLRKTLNNECQGDYIKSVYAQGVRFIPDVITTNKTHQNHTTKLLSIKKEQWILVFALVVVTGFLFYFYNHNRKSDVSITQTVKNSPVAVSVVTVQSTSKDAPHNNQWFFDGGSVYLHNMLSKSEAIKLVNPKIINTKNSNTQKTVIDLLNKKKLDLAVVNDFAYDGEFYTAHTILRNQNGIIEKKLFKATKITQLMTEVSNWVLDTAALANLSVSSILENQDLSTNEFSLQSYMHAMSAQLKGNSKKAIVFLESAVEQDPEFKQAWYELAIAYRKQGNYKKSLAILNSIQGSSDYLAYKIAMVKGHTYDGMNKYQNALAAYQQSYSIVKGLGNDDKVAAIWVSQAITYINLENFVKSRELLDKALQLTNPESQAHFYGVIMNNYAKLEKAQHNYSEASEFTNKAIKAFIKSGDKRYEMQAKTRLSSLLIQLGYLIQAEELAKESLIYAKQQEQLRSISSNHFKLATIYHAIGMFQQSKQHWLAALELNKTLDIPIERATIFEYLIDLHLTFNKLNEVELYLTQLSELRKKNSAKRINTILKRAELKYALASKNSQKAESVITTVDEQSIISLYYGDLSLLKNSLIAAENHYLKALQEASQTSDYLKIVQVMNRLNKLYLQTDNLSIEKADNNIVLIEQYNPVAYPYLKYKAMLYYKQGKKIKAISLLQELKLKANDFWQVEDQLLLEKYQLQ